ncbi:hypothetical protein EYF80_037996 [Liparis tanakae]|uniref:Uncharacterized protein n=1 Tax=Liparis tanakae TaxID=230148 RepID=A0A4Z2GE62_9TELE|nr:hypothetical protein EYF80_037996 [Liparis tanakae]
MTARTINANHAAPSSRSRSDSSEDPGRPRIQALLTYSKRDSGGDFVSLTILIHYSSDRQVAVAGMR